MILLLIIICVVMAALFEFMATLPGTGPYCTRLSRGFLLAAAVLWAFTRIGH